MATQQEALKTIADMTVVPFSYVHAERGFKVGGNEIVLADVDDFSPNGESANEADAIRSLADQPVVMDMLGEFIALPKLTRDFLPAADLVQLSLETRKVMHEAHKLVLAGLMKTRPEWYECFLRRRDGNPEFSVMHVSHCFVLGYGKIYEQGNEHGILEYGFNNEYDVRYAKPALLAGLGHLAHLAS